MSFLKLPGVFSVLGLKLRTFAQTRVLLSYTVKSHYQVILIYHTVGTSELTGRAGPGVLVVQVMITDPRQDPCSMGGLWNLNLPPCP